MKINITEKLSSNTKTTFKPSAIPNIQGWFENTLKAVRFFQSFVSIQFKTGIAVDSLDSIFLNREGGGFIPRNYPSGFL